jgi:hypothetical protein
MTGPLVFDVLAFYSNLRQLVAFYVRELEKGQRLKAENLDH